MDENFTCPICGDEVYGKEYETKMWKQGCDNYGRPTTAYGSTSTKKGTTGVVLEKYLPCGCIEMRERTC